MVIAALLTPARRDAVLAVLALSLLVAPVWAPMLHLGDPTYRYESARVTAEGGSIEYADEPDKPAYAPISIEIACTGSFLQSRACFFERYLAANHTVPTGIATGRPGRADSPTFERYEYAAVNGTVYETSYVANRSHRNADGKYRVELAFEPASAEEALRRVSIPSEDVPGPVREAAASGVATSHRDLDVPKTPVRIDTGTYYRVHSAGRTDPLTLERFAAGLLRWASPLVGLGLVWRLAGRFEVSYVGESRSD